MTLTEQWKKGELKDGYYYAEEGGEELIIHIQGKNGSVMGDDFNIEATDWIKPIAPVPSYEEWKSTGKFAMEAMKVAEENQQLKELLLECSEFLYEILTGTQFKLSFKLESGIRKKYYMISLSELKTKIDNAIGENNAKHCRTSESDL